MTHTEKPKRLENRLSNIAKYARGAAMTGIGVVMLYVPNCGTPPTPPFESSVKAQYQAETGQYTADYANQDLKRGYT